VQRYNAQVCSQRLKEVANSLGVNVLTMSAEEGANAAISAIEKLAKKVGIPAGLGTLGVKVDDIPLLADNALKDVCGLTNPKQASHEEICKIFLAAM
jgi:alcohol dehydrogenase